MKNILSLMLLFFCSSYLGQNLRVITNLPDFIKETSGIIATSDNGIWTHNDSGDGPIIYKIDTNGNLIDSIYLTGVSAVDFEDITKDHLGNFYIGDIGNNSHNRTNLVIYKIPHPDSISGNNVTPEAIHYSYQDQTQFPDPTKNSDCEALFHFQGNLYLISKNWGSSGYSKLYQLPDSAGTFSAILIDSFASGLVTGADIHPNGKLCILEMNRIHVFDKYTGTDFFGGVHGIKSFSLSQKEGICFIDSNTVYITQENHRIFGRTKLYELSLTEFLGNIRIENNLEVGAYPNPAGNYLTINFNSTHLSHSNIKCRIIDSSGKEIQSFKFSNSNKINLPLFDIPSGSYYLEIRTRKQVVTKPFIKK